MARDAAARSFVRWSITLGANNGLVGLDRPRHIRAACSFTRETWTVDSPPIGADCMAESTGSTRRPTSLNCHQRFGAGRQAPRIQGGGAMQR